MSPLAPSVPSKSPMVDSLQGQIKIFSHKLVNHENEGYKSVFVQLTDTCSQLLPIIMRKYKINDDWKKYALFMQFKGQEKCLSYDDCPLQLQNQLRTANDSPQFYIKSIRSTDSLKQVPKNTSLLEAIRASRIGPPNNVGPSSALNSSGGSLAVLSPVNAPSVSSEKTLAHRGTADATDDEHAVAIYEYKAERDDELDVNIGDTFVIRDKTETGWWVVQKGDVTGWVPSGCLMPQGAAETAAPAPANGPVLGTALFDYDAIGVNEISIRNGDSLTVHKTYQHWLLAEK